MLSQWIMAFKSPKSFSFESLEETRGVGRQLDLISYFLDSNTSRRSWIFIATRTPVENEFDFLHIKSEFDKSEELIKLNAKEIQFVTSRIFQTKKNGHHEHWGHRKESLVDVTYRVNRFQKYLQTNQSEKRTYKDINTTAVELVVNGTEIDDDVFEEISDIVSDLPDSIADIKLNLKNKYQANYFLKSVKSRKNIHQIRFKDDPELKNWNKFDYPFTLLFKNCSGF